MEYYIINKSTPPSEYTTILLHSEDLLSKAIYSLETVNHPLPNSPHPSTLSIQLLLPSTLSIPFLQLPTKLPI